MQNPTPQYTHSSWPGFKVESDFSYPSNTIYDPAIITSHKKTVSTTKTKQVREKKQQR